MAGKQKLQSEAVAPRVFALGIERGQRAFQKHLLNRFLRTAFSTWLFAIHSSPLEDTVLSGFAPTAEAAG